MKIIFLIAAVLSCLSIFIIWPQTDLIVSGLFYEQGKGFTFVGHDFYRFMQGVATYGARVLGVGFLVAAVATAVRHRAFMTLDSKSWVFLLLALVLGPGLIANVLLKDHWGRARPREVVEFGGTAAFTPALTPQVATHRNGSFISGDGAFGFFLPSFAYVVSKRRSRQVFWGGVGLGLLFSFSRLALGAHFLSDILFAAFIMLGAIAGLHALVFRDQTTKACWKNWLFLT